MEKLERGRRNLEKFRTIASSNHARGQVKLLSIGNDTKTIHGEKFGILTGVQYLRPHKQSGIANLCAYASKACALACLDTAGVFAVHLVMRGRVVALGLALGKVFGLHARGTALVLAECPVADVIVMADPVHELSAAIGQVPAPVPVVSGGHVGQQWSGSGPHLVVGMF